MTTIHKFLFSLLCISCRCCASDTRMHRHCLVVCSTFKLKILLHTDVIFAEKVWTVTQDAVIPGAWYVTCKCVEFFALHPPLHQKHHNHRNEKHENYHFFSFTLNYSMVQMQHVFWYFPFNFSFKYARISFKFFMISIWFFFAFSPLKFWFYLYIFLEARFMRARAIESWELGDFNSSAFARRLKNFNFFFFSFVDLLSTSKPSSTALRKLFILTFFLFLLLYFLFRVQQYFNFFFSPVCFGNSSSFIFLLAHAAGWANAYAYESSVFEF